MLTVDPDRLALRRGMTVLDAGCGQGRHAVDLLRRGCRTFALDLNPDDLRYARYLLRALQRGDIPAPPTEADSPTPAPGPGPGIAVRGNTLALPFPDAAFDRIVCSEVLEHVDDPRRATAELVRVLKPSGLIAFSVPTPVTEWCYRFSSDDYFNTPGGHVRIFTLPRLRRLLASEGLSVVDLHFEHAFHSLYWWVRCVFGLHDESHVASRHFKKVLTHQLFSPSLLRAERWANWVLPKSMVVYARRQAQSQSTG